MRVYHHGSEYEWDEFVKEEGLKIETIEHENIAYLLEEPLEVDYWINLDKGTVTLDGAQ